jgi:Uma2 family endonuclease
MSSLGSDASTPLPAVDDRIVAPNSGFEIDDGKLVRVPPADEPHGTCNASIATLLHAHIASDYAVAVDMLTRTSLIDDIAPDASVFLRARNPETGGRHLEELAFEVVSTQTLANAASKAARLAQRGVRRVFAVDLERHRVFEWSHALEAWSILDLHSQLQDRTLAVPLPVEALLVAANDDILARAMIAKNPAPIAAMRAADRAASHLEGRAEGRAEGRIEMLLELLERRGLVASAEQRKRMLRERDAERLDRWTASVMTCTSIDELLR